MVRARYKVSDLLRRSRDGRTGLVVFAGGCLRRGPPHPRRGHPRASALGHRHQRHPGCRGSRPDLGLAVAGDLLDKGRATVGEIILVTDGSKGPRTRDTAEALAGRGIRESLLAAGTEEGRAGACCPRAAFSRA